MFSVSIKKIFEAFIHAADLASYWPIDEIPFVSWGINTPNAFIATAFSKVSLDELSSIKPAELKSISTDRQPIFIGFLPFETFGNRSDTKPTPFIFQIQQYLDFSGQEPKLIDSPTKQNSTHQLTKKQIDKIISEAKKNDLPPKGSKIVSDLSDETYLAQVNDVLSDIKAGHYYQLNLLRRFKLLKKWTWSEICQRVKHHGGSSSCLLRHGNTTVASMSPEKFVSIEKYDNEFKIKTWPIKGTQSLDSKSESLASSSKDLAELHMIVDLMRNDLTQVCKPLSVTVKESGTLITLKHLNHLQACIEGVLNPALSFGEILSKLCPAGSITGAPKNSVLDSIQKYEALPRGFFMGNAFTLYSDGSFDSNVLIRTLVSTDNLRTLTYAAGSGIVVKSNPSHELEEIKTKCLPVTS